jgi:hypothetical protein
MGEYFLYIYLIINKLILLFNRRKRHPLKNIIIITIISIICGAETWAEACYYGKI